MSRTYITQQGDMWDSIAFAQLGNTACMDKLMNLNQQYCMYYVFPAGIKLTLPEPANEFPVQLPPWKQVSAK